MPDNVPSATASVATPTPTTAQSAVATEVAAVDHAVASASSPDTLKTAAFWQPLVAPGVSFTVASAVDTLVTRGLLHSDGASVATAPLVGALTVAVARGLAALARRLGL